VNAFAVEPGYNGNPGDPTTLGDVPRNSLEGPKFFQWDFSGMKNFPVTEKMKVQFRGDLFNILNHPNFGNPGNMGICSSITVPLPTTGRPARRIRHSRRRRDHRRCGQYPCGSVLRDRSNCR